MPTVDLIKLINTLLPGFLAAWIFYGLTAHPRKDMFERTIQALVFTGLVQVIVYPLREVVFLCGRRIWSAGVWTDEANLFLSMGIGATMGLVFAGWANNNSVHRWLQTRGPWMIRKQIEGELGKCWAWTKRTSFPSEWFSAFNDEKRWIVLHFKDKDRPRLYGWPCEWPDQPDSGHFLIQEPAWLDDDNVRTELCATKTILVPATVVEFVEIMCEPDEVRAGGAKEDDAEMGGDSATSHVTEFAFEQATESIEGKETAVKKIKVSVRTEETSRSTANSEDASHGEQDTATATE